MKQPEENKMNNKLIVKHAGGRPTKFNKELIFPQVLKYLSTCGQEQAKLPSIAGLANYLDVNKDTIFEWSKKYPEFSDYLKKVASQQEETLISASFFGGREVNASLGIFLLKSIHNYNDHNNETNIQNNVMIIPSELASKYGIETTVIEQPRKISKTIVKR